MRVSVFSSNSFPILSTNFFKVWYIHTHTPTQTCDIMFLGLTFWKGPDSTGVLMASTLWPTSSFPKNWSRSTPTLLSTSEKTPICPRGKYPSLWKRQPLSTNVAPARPRALPNRRRSDNRAKRLLWQIWLWPSRLVKRQKLRSQKQQIKQHRRRTVWWNRMQCVVKWPHHICSIKWLPPSFWSGRPNGGKQYSSVLLWDFKYTSFLMLSTGQGWLCNGSNEGATFVYRGAFRNTTESPLGLLSVECDSGCGSHSWLGEERWTTQINPRRGPKQTRWKWDSKYINLCSFLDMASCTQPICCQQTCSFIKSAPPPPQKKKLLLSVHPTPQWVCVSVPSIFYAHFIDWYSCF